MIGVINGTAEWIFAFPGRLSVTISGADRLLETPRETLARDIWRDVVRATGVADQLPAWQIVRERRATFAALPKQDRQASGGKNEVGQSRPRRRLDRNRIARDDRRRGAIGKPGGGCCEQTRLRQE